MSRDTSVIRLWIIKENKEENEYIHFTPNNKYFVSFLCIKRGANQGNGASRNFIYDGRMHPSWDSSQQESFFLQGSHPFPEGWATSTMRCMARAAPVNCCLSPPLTEPDGGMRARRAAIACAPALWNLEVEVRVNIYAPVQTRCRIYGAMHSETSAFLLKTLSVHIHRLLDPSVGARLTCDTLKLLLSLMRYEEEWFETKRDLQRM